MLWGPTQCLGSGLPSILSPLCGALGGDIHRAQASGPAAAFLLTDCNLIPFLLAHVLAVLLAIILGAGTAVYLLSSPDLAVLPVNLHLLVWVSYLWLS